MKKFIKNIIVILIVVFMLLSTATNTIYATMQIEGALLIKIADADYHLKYYNADKGTNTYIKVSIVGYYKDDIFYPTYCTDKDLNGVGDIGSYHVDVNSMYNNNKIWRVIKNGYPYKTATEMGLSLNWNAYAVTKMAVYCILGQSDINLFSADSNDKEAVNMLKALKDLVNIGLYGTETYSNNVSFEKENEFKEEGRYYTQGYKEVSDVEISEYIIKSISGFPEGTLVVDEDDNVKSLFKSNEKFKIKIPKAKMNEDIDGKINIEAKIRDYVIYDGKSRITGAQNCIVTAKPYNIVDKVINVREKLDKGNIIINKKDIETNKPIADTEFEIYDLNGVKISNGKTDNNGKLKFSNLYQGKYIIKEKIANDNYIIDNTEYEVELKYSETKEVSLTNERKKRKYKGI